MENEYGRNTMIDTDLTSDFLIYNLLMKSDDEFIREFNIKFIDKSVPAEGNNTIYVANIDLETNNETFHSTEYRALVNLFVKTKNTNYIEASQYLRTVVKHIKNVLKSDVTCRRRHIQFRNITYEYGSVYTLKGLHMIIQLNEVESNNISQEPTYISEVELGELDVYVTTDDLHKKGINKKV